MDVRDTLLLASASNKRRASLCSLFEDNFNLLESANSHQTMLFLEQNHLCIAAILLDLTIPDKINLSVLEKLTSLKLAEEIPVIVIVSRTSPEIVASAFDFGATDVFISGYDPTILQRRVQNIIELFRHRWQLEDLVEAQASVLRQSNDAMVDALSSIIEYRSVESGQHILRIRHFTRILLNEIALFCPEYQLNEQTIAIISSAAALHDIGKISIPDSILNKPGKLDSEEWEIMKSHTIAGSRILETLHGVANDEYLRYAYNICFYHHERWDGNGYPNGISQEAIPICAQVVGLADAYDALTTKRVYKNPFPFKKAANMIINGECGIFSPKLLECFKNVTDKFEALAKEYADGLSPKSETFDVTLPAPASLNSLDTLQGVQAKFQTILHHLDGTVAEIDFNQELFHILYNPNPELASLDSNSSFKDIPNALYPITLKEDHEKLHLLFNQGIEDFFESGARKLLQYFRTPNSLVKKPDIYQITFLRLDFSEESRKMIAIWQKGTVFDLPDQTSAPLTAAFSHYLLPEILCLRNDRVLTIEHAGTALSNLLNYTEKELLENAQKGLINYIYQNDISNVRKELLSKLHKKNSADIIFRLVSKSGKVIWVLNKCWLITAFDGTEYLYCMLSDITHNKEQQRDYLQRLSQYQKIFSYTDSILFEWNINNHTISFSPQWKELFGYEPITDNILYKLSASHLHPEDVSTIFKHIHAMQTGVSYASMEARIANAEGRYLWCRIQATATRDTFEKLVKVSGVITNIDSEKKAAKALLDRAEQDPLTKLLNKNTGRKQAEEYLSSFSDGARCALLIIDLDNFKQVNDRFGHMFGDSVLVQAAREIKRLFRSQDIICRIGGDEYMVLMRGIADRELIRNRCLRLSSTLGNIFETQLKEFKLGCSIGIALAPEHGNSYIELFQHADQALYQVKKQGKNNFAFYDAQKSSYLTSQPANTAINDYIDSDEQPDLSSHNIVYYAFERLYSSANLESGIHDILELIGRQMNVSRVYIFENSPDNKTCSNTFEWCNHGINPEIHHLQNISYETDIPGYTNNFNEQGVFYCPDIKILPEDAYKIVETQGIKSMLQCAIMDNGQFRGYVGFDECSEQRYWTQEQIDTLSFFSKILSVFLLKKRAQEETQQKCSPK